MRIVGVVLVGFVVAVSLTGCGNDCGKGTTKNGGECVVNAVTCAPGTTLVDGQCVAGITGCGPFTRFDSANGRCVPSDAVCGSGTQLDESTGNCVPSSEVRCGAGTIQVGTTCVVEPSVLCPSGEVDLGDGCVPGGFVQLIHNSPDPAAAEVGIFINGVRFVHTAGAISNDRVAYRTSTRFLPFPVGDLHVVVTDPAAADDSAPLVDTTVTVTSGSRSALVVGGVINPGAFSGVVQPLAMTTIASALGSSDLADPAGTFRLGIFHGAPDTAALGFVSVLDTVGVSLLYGELGGYFVLPAGVRAFDAQVGDVSLTAFQTSSGGGPFAAPGGFSAGSAAIALASGFTTSQATAPDRTFAMVAALPEGGVTPLLDTAARFQLAHAAVDAGNVAVFVNHVQQVADWPFHAATPFFAVPSGMPFSLAIAPANGAEDDAVIVRESELVAGEVISAIAASATLGAGPNAAERLIVVPALTSTASSTTFSAAVVHAVADAGTVILRDADGNPVGSSSAIAFAQATGYTEVAAGTVAFDLFSAAGPATRLLSAQSSASGAFSAPTGLAAGRTVLIVATGLAADLHLFGLTPQGEFVELDRAVRVQFINAVQAREASTVDLFVNGSSLQTAWPFRSALAYHTYPTLNDTLPVGLQPAGDAALRITRNVDFSAVAGDLVYVVTLLGARANGITNDLYVYPTPGRESSPNPTEVSVNNFNGLSDLEPFDIISAASGALLFDDCDYATYGRNGSIQLTPDAYVFQIADPIPDLPLIQYYAVDVDMTALAGQAIVVLETGFNAPGPGEPSFAAIAVFPNGNVVTLPPTP